jgi:hypothetical protein
MRKYIRNWLYIGVCGVLVCEGFAQKATPSSQASTSEGEQNAKAEFLKNERVSKAATVCMSLTVPPKSTYVPSFRLEAFFSNKTSGFLEIDGKRVLYWKETKTPTWLQNRTSEGVHRITLGVNSPVEVEIILIYAEQSATSIRETKCN